MPDQVVLQQVVTTSAGPATTEVMFNGPVVSMVRSAPTAGRPVVTVAGTMIFDITLGKPIWWDGVALVWVDATGTPV
jgi:hypothetical protein